MPEISFSGFNEKQIGEFFNDQEIWTSIQVALNAKSSLMRGSCGSDADPGGSARTGAARVLNFLGAAQASKRGWIALVDKSAAATVGYKPGDFTLSLTGGGEGTVLNDRFAAYGLLYVQTAAAGANSFQYTITSNNAAHSVAGAGVLTVFIADESRAEWSMFGALAQTDFAP